MAAESVTRRPASHRPLRDEWRSSPAPAPASGRRSLACWREPKPTWWSTTSTSDVHPPRATLIVAAGGVAAPCVADVTDEEEIARLVDAAVATFGSLDIAVNNVGMMGGLAAAPSLELDADVCPHDRRPQPDECLLCSVAEARAMVSAGGGGVIVNVTSGETTRAAPGLVRMQRRKRRSTISPARWQSSSAPTGSG